MAVLQVRNLPEATHRVLKERAAHSGMSLNSYVTQELNRIAQTVSLEAFFDQVRARGEVDLPQPAATLIAEARVESQWR